jgi:hypothetical protein
MYTMLIVLCNVNSDDIKQFWAVNAVRSITQKHFEAIQKDSTPA